MTHVAGDLRGWQISGGVNIANRVLSGHQLGFVNYADSTAKVPFGFLSYVRLNGYRRLELAIALATLPKVLLLDEPLAGVGGEDADALIAKLRALKGRLTMVLIEHDMDAVFALADRISVLVYGQIIETGTADDIRASQVVREAYLGDAA